MTLPNIDTLATYGGVKSDSESGCAVDYTTDIRADLWNKVAASAAGLTVFAVRAWVRLREDVVITPNDHMAVWGNNYVLKPIIASAGNDVYTITWPSVVFDLVGVAHNLSLRAGWANVGWNVNSLTSDSGTDNVSVSANVATATLAYPLSRGARVIFVL